MDKKLAAEILDAYNNAGGAIKKISELLEKLIKQDLQGYKRRYK